MSGNNLFFNEDSPRAEPELDPHAGGEEGWSESDENIARLIKEAEQKMSEPEPERPTQRPTAKQIIPDEALSSHQEESSGLFGSKIDNFEAEALNRLGIQDKKEVRRSRLADEFNAQPTLNQIPTKHAPVQSEITKVRTEKNVKKSWFLKLAVRVLPVTSVALAGFMLIMGVLYVIYRVANT